MIRRFKVYIYASLFSLVSHYRATVNYKSVQWYTRVQLQALLCACVEVILDLTFENNLFALVIAPNTDKRLTRLLILEAVPYSSASILATREI